MNREKYIEKLNQIFGKYDVATNRNNNMIFWGAGAVADAWWDDMVEAGLKPDQVVDTGKAHTMFHGYEVKAPEEIACLKYCDIVIMTTNPYLYQEIVNQIKDMRINTNLLCTCSALYYYVYRNRLKSMLEEVEDESSAIALVSLIEARVEGRLLGEDIVNSKQYFPLYCFSRWNEKEVYVDAGAFVGDTLEHFLFEKYGTFEAYYAFEPLKKNYDALKYRVERLEKEWGAGGKIICMNCGLDREIGQRKMSSVFPVGAMIETDKDREDLELIEITTIDTYFADRRITTIKADIEGKEMDMLLGAAKTIKRWKPMMAISIYHKPSDLFKIFELIKSYDMDYKFSIRCHSLSGGDTILYAY